RNSSAASDVYKRQEQMRALFPPASITGAPKVRTMEILASLETTPRRIYTGTIGFLAPGGRSQWSVAIRTVVVDRETGEAEYGVGGGIVWDSTEEGEYEECRTKAKVLEHRLPAFALLETIRWTPEERFVLLEPHLARLAASSVYFGRALDRDRIVRKLEEAERRFSHAPLRVRLIVEADGAARVEAEPLRAPFPEPYRLRLASSPIDPADPLLYHKTTARSVYDRALEEARAAGCDDALLWNPDGEVTETTIANLAIERGGRLLTPPVRSGLLPGTLRAALLEEGKLAEAPIRIDDLRDGARILLLNSVRGIWPATLVALR
ncbi:MAG: aminotransferase class IV, partial [Candidatus Eisenbacteria bacterium]|nr:aminotransferase class IV [Candidatus Eisenbacteria bacterium]